MSYAIQAYINGVKLLILKRYVGNSIALIVTSAEWTDYIRRLNKKGMNK
tara:strand:+ start:485 stop:631 length:147 start_codon:yes stop_codon:yes gene_type:complete